MVVGPKELTVNPKVGSQIFVRVRLIVLERIAGEIEYNRII